MDTQEERHSSWREFAAHALGGLIARDDRQVDSNWDYVNRACDIADLMLSASAQRGHSKE
jgi:hypothetical protein